MNKPSDWVRPSWVAKHMNVTPATVRNWLSTGQLPGVRNTISGRWAIRRAEAAGFIRANGFPLSPEEEAQK